MMHPESMLDAQTMPSQQMSARRRRRTAVAKKVAHQNIVVSEAGSEAKTTAEFKRSSVNQFSGPRNQTYFHLSDFLPSLPAMLSLRNIVAAITFSSNSTPVSLLSAPRFATHSMLDSNSSGIQNSANSTGIMLCMVFVIGIACVGGAAVCMAMIDADAVQTPRGNGAYLEHSGGSLHHPSGMKHRQPVSIPPVQMSQPNPAGPYDTGGRPTGNFGPPRGASFEESQTTGQDSLCPSLVVPSGTEFVFAVQEVVTPERQEISFNIVDLKGTPLSRVILSESRSATQPKIMLQTMANAPLASVDTLEWHQGTTEPLSICRANGALFGRIQKEPSSGRYVIRHRAGRKLLTFHGDFHEKAINVMSCITGQLVGASEKCVVDFNSASHYQVRVAPSTDAGLVICGLLAIDKLEGSRSTPISTRSPPGYR
jgi:hypothetical protein